MSKPARAKKPRHAILAMRSHGAARLLISVAVLTPSAKRPASFQHIEIDGATDRAVRDEIGLLKGRLRRFELCHYNQPEIETLLDRALAAEGAKPLGRKMTDLSGAAEMALGRRGLGDSSLDLMTLAARHGLSRRIARQSARDPDEAVGLLCDLFASVLLPVLATPCRPIEAEPSARPARNDLTDEDLALLAAPPPTAPPLPDAVPSPVRRRGSWNPDEILDCTLRQRRGASLGELARLTGRSPRAVRAQLIASGFLQRPQARA